MPGGGDKWRGQRRKGADGGNVEAHDDARKGIVCADLSRYEDIG